MESRTLMGIDFSALFYKNLTPMQAFLLIMVRFFMSLIFLGMFYFLANDHEAAAKK